MDTYSERLAADSRLRIATDLVAHSWDPVVLSALRLGPKRRQELLTVIGGINDKALSQAVTRLVRGGLIGRVDDRVRAVTYQLTDLGVSFVNGPLAALAQWGAENENAVLEAQDEHATQAIATAAARSVQ
ncbi:helix-turn-helix domain-containing protein [Rhodococcus sp. IEGM 1379]|uniref:winged helix-turn-helix transcriptional regulator n=1 Tax=Rhodococcus sp. IEGM 1379 TaxID=3047086 RepID=UPI0024B78637|nr:helix-turn-helix domain-containing protein [Rhodococcus sp. IEGM 1379]MDI9919112.1 helix-turn-helix domain-containing protein [Rhodococcus sp. IEGM 1379]